MKRADWAVLDEFARSELLARPAQARDPEFRATVAQIIADVHVGGDAALRDCTARFDRVTLDAIAVGEAEWAGAEAMLDSALRCAIREAAARIEAFHRACMAPPVSVETAPGVRVERMARSITRVGLYVPAGSTPLPSTALMLGIPARLAGCPEILLCTPPQADGGCDPAVLYAARICGVHRVFKIGGAQAIAAMAFGTQSVSRCDKLFGPGNAYVTEAKLQISVDSAGAAIDMPAGPSEALVIADADADPVLVAADLLSQAEHGPDSQVLLVSDSPQLLDEVGREVQRQCAELPRASIAAAALAHARLIGVDSLTTALEVSNRYAPEHLILTVREPRRWLDHVQSAGSVFLGAWTPESVGDYCSGSNHVLPTYGWARAISGLSVASFRKQVTVQECSESGLRAIGPCAATLATAERLDAHRRAVTLRLARLDADATGLRRDAVSA